MKFSSLTTVLSAAAVALATQTATVAYSQQYDNPNLSMNGVACSNGANGMESKGYTQLGQLPGFPNVGGAFAVGSWNSTECGTCWQLTYQGTSINVLAIDHSAAGTFNIALEAMNTLTDGQAINLGRVTVSYQQVATSACN